MNGAHLHMLVNHFPIIGTIFGLGILIAGLVFKNNAVKNVAYFLFIIAAVFAAISSSTGEMAEDLVKNIPSVDKNIINQHAHFAALLSLTLYVLGVISIGGIYMNFRKHTKAYIVTIVAIFIAIVGLVFVIQTGNSGGDIRHTEIRTNRQSTFFFY